MKYYNDLSAILDGEILYQIAESPTNLSGFAMPDADCRIVIVYKTATGLSATDSDLLEKMMLGIKTRLLPTVSADYSLQINLISTPHTLSQIVNLYQPTHFLGFGVTRADLGLNIMAGLYQPVQFLGINLLFAESLSVLAGSAEKKAKLWEGMKISFAP